MLAFGDSITNGGGELQWGVALQSWALWVARGLGLPYSGFAVDGARIEDVVAEQIPAFEHLAPAGARYDLGCLYIGVNDARAFDWDASAFEQRFGAALGFLAERCERVLTLTAPLDLGRPRAGPKVVELDAAIERVASAQGALLLDLRDFGARNLLMSDHVHPTALGQVAIAERALDVLAADGVTVAARPSGMIRYEPSRWGRLRSDLTYTYRHLKVSARAAAILAWLRVRPPRSPR